MYNLSNCVTVDNCEWPERLISTQQHYSKPRQS